ncbi:MAG: TatD family deoxyribonuclease [Alphaproteobacteria bacterium]|nr:TatD family deoxyribonuclease [Alphaproteobacteria bacterium]
MTFVDSHCHLDFEALAKDRAAVLARAKDAGVGAMLTIGTRRNNADVVKAIADANENVWCTVGIHPHEADNDRLMVEDLVRMSTHPKVVGIGETGLDYYYENASRDGQLTSFRAHCAAAREAKLPLVVHARDADSDVAQVLKEESHQGALCGVLHCFSSGWDLARVALDLGFYVSISGIVTFKNADDLRAIVPKIPLDRLLIETDAPFLAPAPHRGRANEPALLVHTAGRVAEVVAIPLERLAEQTTANFHRLFGRAQRPLA